MKGSHPGLAALSVVILLAGSLSLDLPTESSTLFAGSGRCELCHAAGSGVDAPMRDTDGTDISPVTLWRSTVMANAARDPVWQARVAAEVQAHPALQSVIEDKCTTCHTPLGRTEAHFLGAADYSLAEAVGDPLAMDGVSCTLCHQIQADGLGSSTSFSGHYVVDDSRTIFGPYTDVLSQPMISSVNYSAEEGPHLSTSELCATCHTLFTPTVDNAGQIVGEIAEQTPYLEWLNSVFPDRGIECQSCHMPEVEAPTAISTIPPGLPERGPFSRHYFVGGNTSLLQMLRREGTTIGVTADSVLFDSTLARTGAQLGGATADLSASYRWLDPDTLEVTVKVVNRAGHKFPSGYPSRLAWLNVAVRDEVGTTVFETGRWNDQTLNIDGLDQPFEPHHDLIRSQDQVVVYQSLMGDVDGELTWTLLRGATYLKDNRIPPEGFSAGGSAYDSTAIIGGAASDDNFNRDGGVEGSGSDEVTVRIGGLDRSSSYSVSARLRYQTWSTSFVQDLLQYTGAAVDRFREYYSRQDVSPVTVDSVGLAVTSTSITPGEQPGLASVRIFPNPSASRVTFSVDGGQEEILVQIYSLSGELVARLKGDTVVHGAARIDWTAPDIADGVYLCRISSGRTSWTGTFVLLR